MNVLPTKQIAVLLILLTLGLKAQNSSSSKFSLEESLASIECLKELEELISYSRVKDEIESYRYKARFLSDTVSIVNEALPANQVNVPTTINGYVNSLSNYEIGGTLNTYQFRPYSLELKTRNAERYIFTVKVQKELGMLSFKNNFYRDTLSLKYTLHYDREKKEAKVAGIELLHPANAYLMVNLPESITENKDLEVLVNGQKQKQDLETGMLLRLPFRNQELDISPDSDEYLGGYHKTIDSTKFGPYAVYDGYPLEVKFRPKRFFIKAEYYSGQSLGSTDQSLSLDNVDFGSESFGSEFVSAQNGFGASLGFRFLNFKDKFFMALQVGAGNRDIRYAAKSDRLFYSYSSEETGFGDITRLVEARNIEESGEVSLVNFGGGLNFRFRLHRYVHLELGADYYTSPSGGSGNYRNTAWFDYAFIWNRTGIEIGGNNADIGTVEDFQLDAENTENDLVLSSASWLNFRGDLSFRINKRLWLETGIRFESQNLTFEFPENYRFSDDYEANATPTESLAHLIGGLEPINLINYSIGIKFYL